MDKIEEGTKELIGRKPFSINSRQHLKLPNKFWDLSDFYVSGNFLHMFGVDSTIEDIWNSSRWVFLYKFFNSCLLKEAHC